MTATVRSVRVVLEAEVAKYIADMKLAGRETDTAFAGVERRLVGTDRQLKQVDKSSAAVGKTMAKTNTDVRGLDREVDKLSGRLRLFRDIGVTIGPVLIPLGAAVIPLVTGSVVALGAAAGGIGTLVLALGGLGDAFDALDAFQLDPTAENLRAVHDELERLGPAGADFVRFIDSLDPALQNLREVARDNMFPGVEEGITELMARGPEVVEIIAAISEGMGRLTAEAGADLAGSDWQGFWDYLRTDAEPTLVQMGRTLGNFTNGFANLIVGLAPATRDFGDGLEGLSQRFEAWSRSLDSNDTFQDFVAYIRESGPEAVELLGAIAVALVGIARAAAPVGSIALPVLTAVVQVLGAIANSPVGSTIYGIAAALIVFNRAAGLAAGVSSRLNLSFSTLAKTVGALIALEAVGFAVDFISEKAAGAAPNVERLTAALIAANNAKFADEFGGDIADFLALIDQSGTKGFAQDLNNLAGESNAAHAALLSLASFTGFQGTMLEADVTTRGAAQAIESLDDALAGLVARGSPQQAQDAFAALAEQQGLTAAQQEQLLDLLPNYSDALQAAANDALLASGATETFIGPTRDLADALEAQTDALNHNVQAMRRKRDETLAAFDAETQWRVALKAAREQADKNNAGIRGMSDAAIENRQQIGALADAWNNQDKAVKNNVDRYRSARDSFIQTARDMGLNKKAAEELADSVLEIPRSIVIKARTEAKQAKAELEALQDFKFFDKYIHVHTVRDDSSGVDFQHGGQQPIKRHAGGGRVRGPGTTTSDSIPALLSDREYVVKAASVDRYGVAMMDSINAGHFARGGSAGGVGTPYAGGSPFAPMAHAVDDVTEGLKGLERQLSKAEKAVERETKQRDRLQDRYDSIAGSTTDSLRSDLFTSSGNVWASGGGMSDPISVLQSDIAQTEAFDRLRERLAKRGLDDGALEAAAAGGVAGLQQIAGYSPAQLALYERLFNQRQRETAHAGAGLAETLVGSKLDRSNERLDRLIDRVHEVEQAVKHADHKNQEGHNKGPEKFAQQLDNLAGAAASRAH